MNRSRKLPFFSRPCSADSTTVNSVHRFACSSIHEYLVLRGPLRSSSLCGESFKPTLESPRPRGNSKVDDSLTQAGTRYPLLMRRPVIGNASSQRRFLSSENRWANDSITDRNVLVPSQPERISEDIRSTRHGKANPRLWTKCVSVIRQDPDSNAKVCRISGCSADRSFTSSRAPGTGRL